MLGGHGGFSSHRPEQTLNFCLLCTCVHQPPGYKSREAGRHLDWVDICFLVMFQMTKPNAGSCSKKCHEPCQSLVVTLTIVKMYSEDGELHSYNFHSTPYINNYSSKIASCALVKANMKMLVFNYIPLTSQYFNLNICNLSLKTAAQSSCLSKLHNHLPTHTSLEH